MGKLQLFNMDEDYEEDWDKVPSHKRRQDGGGKRTDSRPDNRRNKGTQPGDRRQKNENQYKRNEKQYKGYENQYQKNENHHKGHEKQYKGYENQQKQHKKKRKKKSGFKKFLLILLLLLLLLGGGLYYLVGQTYKKLNYVEIESLTDAPLKEDGAINVLLIGNDSRDNSADGRSDAMILLTISSKSQKIYMTSLLRDMYVDIPGHDGNRLNAAYSFGGAELLMETIEQNFDITVNRYVLVNFEAFANLVDAVDGVELELTSEEIEYVNGYLVEYNMLTDRPQGTDNMDTSVSGLVHLNGPQALAYSRNRYLGTDFGRTERQRKVLGAVMAKLPKAVVTHPKQLMDGILPNLTTNLTKNECFRLCLELSKLLAYDMEQNSIPIAGSYRDATIRGMAVLEVDFETNKQYLQENVYGKK
ncbi:MAG: LCP family protein [Roseburia sp.]|nr:LCP family protein [Roseburia sp.]